MDFLKIYLEYIFTIFYLLFLFNLIKKKLKQKKNTHALK